MAFWIFKYNPDIYRFDDRMADPNPVISWTVSRFREQISPGDTAFVWATGEQRGIRSAIRIDEAPRDMPELESEQPYWVERDGDIRCRILGTITHRALNLLGDQLRQVPGLADLTVFHGFQQATNFPVSADEGRILMHLVEQGGVLPETVAARPSFEVGRVYSRRTEIHGPFGGQQQGGISTPTRVRCVFLFTSAAGEQHGYRDGRNDDGVFLYTGEGQVGDMGFVRGNLAIRDHAVNGRDLHLFESLGKGEGCRYLGRFDCVGWQHRRGPDTSGQERQLIVFHLVPEEEVEVNDFATLSGSLEELRQRALAAVRPPAERSPRESRRLYHERSAAVRAYVLARASGTCEACRKPAPFNRPDGKPYLEPHHTRRMADGGPDHPRWVGGICPNCHREVHHGEHGGEVNGRLEEYLGSIEPEVRERE